MIQEGDVAFLNQALKTLEEAFEKLKKAYDKKDAAKFNEFKKTLVSTQRGILEAAR